MHWVDWIFALVPLTIVVGVGLYAQRYVKCVSDFLAAGRVAGRYVISVAGGENGTEDQYMKYQKKLFHLSGSKT